MTAKPPIMGGDRESRQAQLACARRLATKLRSHATWFSQYENGSRAFVSRSDADTVKLEDLVPNEVYIGSHWIHR